MEWALQVQRKAGEVYVQAASSDISRVFDVIDPSIVRIRDMLSNGARLYKDVGDHPEYATPEDTSFMGTVANEIAGEDILYDALVTARKKGAFHDFILNKRVVDDQLNTWGYHVSLSADARKVRPTEQDLAPLGPHLATMGLYTGAGAVARTNDSANYVTSQKVLNLNADFGLSSHQKTQPLISLRDEPLAPSERFSRIHITSLDANMSPWATWMKLGTTSLVLRMMEQGYWDASSMEFEDDMHQVAIKTAYDPDMERVVRLADGGRIRPLDVQGELLLRAQKMAHIEGVTGEEESILREWERAVNDLAVDPEKLIDRVDWIAKRAVLRRYMGRHCLELSESAVAKKDRQWSHIGPSGIATRLRETVWQHWMPLERIERAYTEPPRTTRALARAAFIRKYADKAEYASVSWDSASVYLGHGEAKADFPDPYKTTTSRFSTILPPNPDDAIPG